MGSLPLDGVRVIELGQLIAGPFAAKILGEFGAEIIKIEPPEIGDPLRKWRLLHNGTSVWWQVQSRNKQSVTLDLRQPEAQGVVKKLVAEADVLIENFRPGTLEKWGLGWDSLKAVNPKLIMLRVSGYGQTGPYRDRPGFGVIGEAMGGLRYLCGEPGQTPVRVGVSIGDSLSGLYGVIGVLLALLDRKKSDGAGQVIDVALYESVFSIMESLLSEYSAFGAIREPAGSSLPGIAPSNAYLCRGGRYVLVAGNGDSIYKRLMRAIERDDLADDPELSSNEGRARHVARIDDAIESWTSQRELEEVLDVLQSASVPVGPIYNAADISADPHYRARNMILRSSMPDGKTIEVPGIVPKLGRTPGQIRSEAPKLGQHTDRVLRGLGIDSTTCAEWRQRHII